MLKMLKSKKNLIAIISIIVLVIAFSFYYFFKLRNKTQLPTNFNAVTVDQKIQVLKDLNKGGDTNPKTEAQTQQIVKEKTQVLNDLSAGFNNKKSMSVEQKTNLLNSLQ